MNLRRRFRRSPNATVLDLVKRLADKGLGVVLISHNLHDIFEVSDRITVCDWVKKSGCAGCQEYNPTRGYCARLRLGKWSKVPRDGGSMVKKRKKRPLQSLPLLKKGIPLLSEYVSAYWKRMRGGDLGSLPIVLGCSDYLQFFYSL